MGKKRRRAEWYRKLKEKGLSRDEIVEKRIKQLVKEGKIKDKGFADVARRVSIELEEIGISESIPRIRRKIGEMPLKYSEKIRKPHQPYLKIGLVDSKKELKISKDQKKMIKWLEKNKVKGKSREQLEEKIVKDKSVDRRRVKEFLDKLEEKGYRKLSKK